MKQPTLALASHALRGDLRDTWLTSWLWTERRLRLPAPSTPLAIPEERAERLMKLFELAITSDGDGVGGHLLALARKRLGESPAVAQLGRLQYRVSARMRFPAADGARGPTREAARFVAKLEESGELPPTRGPFHLSELISLGALALLTVRADILAHAKEPTLRRYVPIAVTRGGGALEPMQIGLLDIDRECVVWTDDNALSRAWHAPMAGGEILEFLPTLGPVQRPSTQWPTVAA